MPPSDFEGWTNEDTLMELSDVLTEVSAGRTEGHACPRCGKGPLDCEAAEDGWVRVRCPHCRLSFEGLLG